ncbi:ABC transporter permease [Aeromonas sp. 80P]
MNLAIYYIAFKSILAKEVSRFTRIWIQTLVPPAITMSLYFVIFGNLIGSRIGDMGGFTYMEFIVPGLIMMSVITNSYSNVASSFFSAKFQRNIEEMLVAPVPNYVIIAGYVGGGVARGLCVGLIVTLVSLFFVPLQIHHLFSVCFTVLPPSSSRWVAAACSTPSACCPRSGTPHHLHGERVPLRLPLVSLFFVPLQIHHLFSVCFTVLLTAILFSLGGLINAVFAKTFDDISIIPTFVLTPLTYLGGVFYSISLLPPFWQSVSQVNPIIYMVNAFRYGFLGISDVPLGTAYLIIIGFIVALYGIAWWLISRGTGLRH